MSICQSTPSNATMPPSVYHATFQGLIGVARRDITPPVGIYARNWGAARHDVAEGIHRPMTLTALALKENPDAPPLILIAADLGWWREESTERLVREPVLAALNLDPARLIFNLSHTHATAAVSPAFANMPGGELIADYIQLLCDATLAAAQEALKNVQPATLDWTSGRCDLACNRDLPDPAPKGNPRIVCGYNPANTADDTVWVGRVVAETPTGSTDTSKRLKILATIVNYACHPVTLAWDNRLISPDYVGAMREVVEEKTDAPCLFLQGASGELSPAREYLGDLEVADSHGRRLGYATLSALENMLPPLMELAYEKVIESGAPLASWILRPRFSGAEIAQVSVGKLGALRTSLEMEIKRDYPPAAEIERQLASGALCHDRVMEERMRRKLGIRQSLGDGSHVLYHQWQWQVGEACFSGIPHEAYSQMQLELRKKFAPHPVVVMNLVNGCMGYLAPKELYDLDLYQVWQSPFERGCLEQVTAVCSDGLERLLK